MDKVKEFLEYLSERFGIQPEIFSDYVFSVNGERIRIFSKGILDKNLEGMNVKGIGLRAGTYFKKNNATKIKISTNFAQIFGIYATKNVIELDEDETKRYIQGNDIEKKCDVEEGSVIIRRGEDIIGVGSYHNGIIKNQIPKAKRIIRWDENLDKNDKIYKNDKI